MPFTEALALHRGAAEVLETYHSGFSLTPSLDASLHDEAMDCDDGPLPFPEGEGRSRHGELCGVCNPTAHKR